MKYVKGDVTKATEKFIIHGCNAQGVMGSGVALAIKQKWQDCYLHYVKEIKANSSYHNLGNSYTYVTKDGKIIGNLITQEYFGSDGKAYASLDAIRNSLEEFIFDINMINIFGEEEDDDGEIVIASPKIGCGLGGLKWENVSKIYEDFEQLYDVTFVIYEI